MLLSQWIALLARRAYLVLNAGQSSVYAETPWSVAASAVVALFLAMILLLDCSPSLPATAQIILMVTARHRPTPIRFSHASCSQDFGSFSDTGVSENFVVYTPVKAPIASGILARIEYVNQRNFCQFSAACSC